MPFINSPSSAITGRNQNWRDNNLCPTKICRQLSDWLRLTRESSRVQPCLRGRSAGSFPKQWLVIEPIKTMGLKKFSLNFTLSGLATLFSLVFMFVLLS